MAFVTSTYPSRFLEISSSSRTLNQRSFLRRKLQSRRAYVPLSYQHRSSLSMVAAPSKAPENATKPPVETFDVIVIGGGPAGLSLASGLGNRGVKVLCADVHLDRPWPNNYGTWVDDLEPLGLADCVSHVWEKTAAFVRADGKKSVLDRTYARVDRLAMKSRFLDRCKESGNVTLVHAAASEVDTNTSPTYTFVSLEPVIADDSENAERETQTFAGRVVVDATGHSLRFVQFNEGKTPGFQAAYGIECIVSEKGYEGFESDEMMLMDFRDDHMQGNAADKRSSEEEPTFIYVMPLDEGKGRHVFFEETSLVASPAMDFETLKTRLHKRLDHYGIEVESILDEEHCLIPMGGEMPNLRQRVVAFGGAAALVHPATGYMIARALELADEAAGIIANELREPGKADTISFKIWDRIWNEGRCHQRDFFNFGGEYLQRINLKTTRDFFSAFFDLPKEQWAGFLSFRLMKPLERFHFGLGVFARTTNRVRTTIVPMAVLEGGLPLLMSILPVYKTDADE
uniref:lycopene beta-cyclase n=1 Tax=Grateloupia catenata TaxID=118369 RepID=A0A290WNJ5_9FLOR|nr:lycopene beta-cyclase [Grateloupia catenata]